MDHETPAQRQERIDRDLEVLRILAWCVQRNRYSAEPVRIDGGRRGKARIGTFTFYVEATDLAEGREAGEIQPSGTLPPPTRGVLVIGESLVSVRDKSCHTDTTSTGERRSILRRRKP